MKSFRKAMITITLKNKVLTMYLKDNNTNHCRCKYQIHMTLSLLHPPPKLSSYNKCLQTRTFKNICIENKNHNRLSIFFSFTLENLTFIKAQIESLLLKLKTLS